MSREKTFAALAALMLTLVGFEQVVAVPLAAAPSLGVTIA